ncbi:DUF1963 domain-containing protein [Actinoplanes sp. NBRC 103695]|uniref:DUF1963 domain-containing protein n=1 Tax=Actinoplanes sp. NBRC 103695 TaxID=3032202 RepID=UPI0024A1486F|nr:DUF1963 domain-containing protein [Actinoplanes sp. NBRC 103695]GLY97251.1 hypothetical protein Acsp02_45050 [Actinoplanes sp. NBRC 103695]
MDRYEQFRSAAVDRGIPEDEIGKFAELIRFGVWTWLSTGEGEVVGQVGGLPRLPVGVEWPGGSFPLPFVGSVDCAALPRAEGFGLPEDGSLLFFLHHEEDIEEYPTTDYSRVLYVPAGTETEEAAPPPGHDSRSTYMDETIPFLIPEHWIVARVRPELPEWIEDRDVQFATADVKKLFGSLKHLDGLCEVVEQLWPEERPNHHSTLQLGGYCRNIGSGHSPHSQMAGVHAQGQRRANPEMSQDEWRRLEHEEEERLVRQWVPLAQFSTESEFYYGCFLIDEDDLAAKRFDKIHSCTMFTE